VGVEANKHFRGRHKEVVVFGEGVDGEDTSAGNIQPVSDQFLQTGLTIVAHCDFQTMDVCELELFKMTHLMMCVSERAA